MSARKTYAVRNASFERGGGRGAGAAARRQGRVGAAATRDGPAGLCGYEPNCALWDWVATVVESEPLG